MKLAQVRKSVRLSTRLLARVGQAASVSGRSLSSEILSLLESGILSHRGTAELPQRDRRFERLEVGEHTEVIVLTLSPALVGEVDAVMLPEDFAGKTFSDKIRYLVSVGIGGLGRAIGMELSSLDRVALGQNQILTPNGLTTKLDINANTDLVFVLGEADQVLAEVGAWMLSENERGCVRVNYFDVGSQAGVLGDTIIYWKRRTRYSFRQVLILNGVEYLSLTGLSNFVTESMALNVQLVMLSPRVGSLPAETKVEEVALPPFGDEP